MFSAFFVCFFYFVLVQGDLQEVSLPVYSPPSQEEILNTYFRDSEETEGNRTKKSILDASDSLQKTVEVMKKELTENISNLEKELTEKNVTQGEVSGNVSSPHDYIRMGVLKNFLTTPIEPTTYRYPTAIWSSQNYEKLKTQRFRPRNATKIYLVRPTLNPAYVYLDRGYNFPGKSHRRSRGKTKWKDVARVDSEVSDPGLPKDDRSEYLDRFLEQSLDKYLTSSNLRENVGNVSVKTFSDILKNITDQKPKRLQSPYDENKELRMKFREEVILKKKSNEKNDTKPQSGFLEKQLQRRLEKVQDVFNEKDKDKILANMWRYATLNRTTDLPEDKRNKSTDDKDVINTTTTELPTTSIIYITTENPEQEVTFTTQSSRGSVKFYRRRFETTEGTRRYDYVNPDDDGTGRNLLRAEETAYYRRGHFPSLTFIGQPEKPGVIPGRPLIDYPMHSFPPATKFKCPKFKDGKPRMMADPETRCQVFYICMGDGPTTAMLCPNGTMFNENFLVCDWWYNVNC